RALREIVDVLRAAKPTAVMVGRMSAAERYKGHREVIEAWPNVVARVPEAQLRIVGGGDDAAAITLEIKRRALDGSIEMLGRIDDAALARTLASAHVFVMPSRVEGFGLVYAEAARSGLPSIAHVPGPASEIIDDGRTGWLVDGRDRDAIARALIAALSDLPTTIEMGLRARAHVETTFTQAAFARSLRDVCEAAIQGSA
ncbi:MAG: glycosyltransferase, partial [Polyangiales bacterium]